MKKIRTQLTYDYKSEQGEKFTLPSLTCPDEALSITEILQRFSQGYEFPRKPAHYTDSEDFEDYDPTVAPDFDLSDAHEELTTLGLRIEQAQAEKPKPKETAEAAGDAKPDEV